MADGDGLALLASHPALNIIRDPSRFPEPREGLHRAEISGAGIGDRDDLFDALAPALELPDWFGRNWDALSDSLRDLAWIEPGAIALLVSGAGEMLSRAPHASAHLLEIWSSAAVAQAERGRVLQLYLALA